MKKSRRKYRDLEESEQGASGGRDGEDEGGGGDGDGAAGAEEEKV